MILCVEEIQMRKVGKVSKNVYTVRSVVLKKVITIVGFLVKTKAPSKTFMKLTDNSHPSVRPTFD